MSIREWNFWDLEKIERSNYDTPWAGLHQMTDGHSTQFHPLFLTYWHKHGRQSFLSVINFLALAHLMSAMMSTPPASMAVTQASIIEATKTAHTAALSSVHYSLAIGAGEKDWVRFGSAGMVSKLVLYATRPRTAARTVTVVKMIEVFMFWQIKGDN